MILFPNCKINLGLYITSKRSDGYHNLQTIFYPVPLCDALEVIESPEVETGVAFTTSGLPISGDASGNLCVKAYQLLKADFSNLPPVKMHLHKVIPMGAGLGGGSSNGAFTLLLLNQKFSLGLHQQQLMDYALQLGSDCPFFILNKPAIGSGRGEILEPVALSLSGYKLLLVNPGIHVSTRDAFTAITPSEPAIPVESILQLPVSEWRNQLSNDFEKGVFAIHPPIAAIKQQLYGAGAVYASMSGSGSTVFGIFEKDIPVSLSFAEAYFTREILL